MLGLEVKLDSAAQAFFRNAALPHCGGFGKMAGQAIYAAAVMVIEHAIGRGKVPKESTALQQSGFCTIPDERTLEGSAGFSTPYAAYIHEGVSRFSGLNLIPRHGGQIKFLQAQLDEDGPMMGKEAARAVAERLARQRGNLFGVSSLQTSPLTPITEDEARAKAAAIWTSANPGRNIGW